MKSRTYLYLDFIHELGNGAYELEGFIGGRKVELGSCYLSVNNQRVHLTYNKRKQSQDFLSEQDPIPNSTFKTVVHAPEDGVFSLKAYAENKKITIRANRFTGLSSLFVSYTAKGTELISLSRGVVTIAPKTIYRHAWLELKTLISIMVNWRVLHAGKKIFRAEDSQQIIRQFIKGVATVLEALAMIPRDILLRIAYIYMKRRKARPIWIISDRLMAAGDNGEILFDYIQKQKNVPADVFFILSKKSSDYKRLSLKGRVLQPRSLKYYLYFLLSDLVISSQADIEVINPFFRQIDRLVGLFNYDFVFLQHGIIRYDLSSWLNRYNRNIKLFITSSVSERDSILNYNYYDENTVLLSGLPRYDRLQSTATSKLIIAPTYRKNLLASNSKKDGTRKYNPNFKTTEYYKFYSQLLQDDDIAKVLRSRSLKGEFFIHPVFSEQVTDFEGTDVFEIMRHPYDYNKAFCESALFVTDYSSVVFDVAYMRKPIIYAQFDQELFLREHITGETLIFDDKNDGFGPVCADFASVKKEIIKALNSNWEMPQKYKNRVDRYFEFRDIKNTERVYHAILELAKNQSKTSKSI
jgi:CDP-glycerol glycerophosphotransferase (TagB/SpsB family)